MEKKVTESMNIVTRHAIQEYAEAVENQNPIHASSEAAARLGYDNVIAPATFHVQYKPLKLAVGSAGWLPQGAVHTKQEAHFSGIVKAGDYLYFSTQTVETVDHKGRKCLEFITTAKNQHDKIVYQGKMTNLLPS